MRWARVILLASGASVIAGCGRSTDGGGAGPMDGGAGGIVGGETNTGGAGGVGGSETNTGGAGVGGTGAGGAGQGGSGGEECQAIQLDAELAAERSCQLASDCVRPPHMTGDCTDCGLVTNISSTETSLDAVRSACGRFYENGCEVQPHPCPAYRPSCVSGVCAP